MLVIVAIAVFVLVYSDGFVLVPRRFPNNCHAPSTFKARALTEEGFKLAVEVGKLIGQAGLTIYFADALVKSVISSTDKQVASMSLSTDKQVASIKDQIAMSQASIKDQIAMSQAATDKLIASWKELAHHAPS